MTIWEIIALAKAGDGGGGGGETSLFRFKGSVLTTDDLPDSGENGDVYHVDADGGEYAYIVIEGQEPYWESLGPLVVVDSALSGTSESPVQNKIVKAAIDHHDLYNKNIATYGGADLSTLFESAEAMHNAVSAGDFSKIHIGDYWPITLNGNYTDFARFTVPVGTTYYTDAELTTEGGTTEAAEEGEYQSATAIKFKVSGTDAYAAIEDCTVGFVKSMNAVAKMEVAAINPYLQHGDTSLYAQHILFCSRDCLPPTLQYRCSNSVWLDTAQVNPWRGSHLWATLNDANNGIIKLAEATALGNYIFKGPNNKGMRAMLPSMASGTSSPNNWAWTDRGRLFLPMEREVYGANAWASTSGYEAGNLYNKWLIFDGSSRHVIKGSGNGGGRCLWWLESAADSTAFAYVNYYGIANSADAAYSSIRVPLCFLFT